MNKKLLIVLIAMLAIGAGVLLFNITKKGMKNIPVTEESCFEFNSDKGEIKSIKDVCGEEVNIPSTIGGVKVISLGSYAFRDKGLTYVKIPNTVETIGIGAFYENDLTEVTIPESVTTIKPRAFMSNKLIKVDIPSTVKTIGFQAFNDNQVSGDNSFIYMRNNEGEENKEVIISYAGKNRDKVVIPEQVTQIYLYAFSECDISGITLNDKLERIESNAFLSNKLVNITIPKNVIIINQNAFSDNIDLVNISIQGKNSIEDFSNFDITDLNTDIIKYEGTNV